MQLLAQYIFKTHKATFLITCSAIPVVGNGDIKTVDGRTRKVKYFYSKANTTHTTFPDGIEVFEFPNGQVEKHFVDGSKEITFGDGTKKYIYSDGQQLSVFPNGKRMVEDIDGNKHLL